MKQIFIFTFILFSLYKISFSQDDSDAPRKKSKGAKGLHVGLYASTFFSGNYASKLYDGWGYDANGNRNNFQNSFMNRRINYDYGGGNGYTDYVAQTLGVNHGEWSFDSTDMPAKMKYVPAFMYGMNLSFGFTKKDAIIFNLNVVKLTLNGNFTIVITNPQIGPTQPNYQNIQTFGITGGEQRLILQAGYRKILGNENGTVNLFFEMGPSMNYTKFTKNTATITGPTSSLPIDLSYYYNQPYYSTYHASYLRGTGFGVFATFGMNLNTNSKWTIQFLYNPSLEKINIADAPKLAMQNSIGIRAIYNF